MTTQEREAIYEHCACEAEKRADECASGSNASIVLRQLATAIREHAADPVRYP